MGSLKRPIEEEALQEVVEEVPKKTGKSKKRPVEAVAQEVEVEVSKKSKKRAAESEEVLKQDTGTKKQKRSDTLGLEEAKAYFAANVVKVHVPEGKDVDISPLDGFRMNGFAKALVKHCQSKFEKPTAIQACCWPIIMQRSDVCGIAKTGSGKTMAFALPYLSMSARGVLSVFEQPNCQPRFVAMAPTRELAQQIATVCEELALIVSQGDNDYPVQCIYGGVPKHEQKKILRTKGADMIIATPGRLQDLTDEEALDLSYVQYLVLDEADRMLDMGFIDAVKKLIGQMPKAGERQTCMFSATWPASVHNLAVQFLDTPVHVGIGSVDEGLTANTAIRQEVEILRNERDKNARLLHHLKKHYTPTTKVIIFGLYKKEVAFLEKWLWDNGFDKAIALQGDMTQDGRSKAIADFKKTACTPLVATDVAGRGLDINDVELVINYTFPLTIEDYVHRIGRTGRAGKKGLAVTFFCPDSKGVQDEKAHAGDLVKIMTDAGQHVPEELAKIASTSGGNKATKKKAHPLFGAHFKDAAQMAALEAKKVHTTFADSDDE